MGQSLSMSVQYDQPAWKVGSRLTGRVILRVLEDDKVHTTQLVLKFHGREESLVKVTKTSGKTSTTYEYTGKKDIISVVAVLANFDGSLLLRKGDFVFPFALDLPPSLPAGFSYRVPGGHCSLIYTCQASLLAPGMLWGKAEHKSHESTLIVLGAPLSLPAMPSSMLLPPRADKSVFCGCWAHGDIHSGALVSRQAVPNGESLQLLLALENHSSTTIKRIDVTLYENVECKAENNGNVTKASKVINTWSTSLLPTDARLGGLAAPKSGKADQHQETNQRLTSLLQSGASPACCSIDIPINGCTNDFNGSIITIRHQLVIDIITSFGTPNHSHECRLWVQPSSESNSYEIEQKIAVARAENDPALPADWNPTHVETLAVEMPSPAAVAAPVWDGPTPTPTPTPTAGAPFPPAPPGGGGGVMKSE